MAIIKYFSLDVVPKMKRIVVIGNFDGIHPGHKALINLGKSISNKLGYPLMVFTFYPQYQSIVNNKFKYILTQYEKFLKLEALKVDEVLSLPFSEDISRLMPEFYVKHILMDILNAQEIIIGFDHTFGYKASGSAQDMLILAAPIPVHIVDAVTNEREAFSSTNIRQAIREGNIQLVEDLLEDSYHLSGKVIHGLKNGRKYFVPTANISLPKDLLLPKSGVYAGTCQIVGEKKKWHSVINIGKRPTIDDSESEVVEAHLLDFNDNLYGKIINLSNLHFMRDIEKYESFEKLKHAIDIDILNARNHFKNLSKNIEKK